MPIAVVAVLGVPVCALIGWWLWLRSCRHVVDHHGIEALKVVPRVATSYRDRPVAPRGARVPSRPRQVTSSVPRSGRTRCTRGRSRLVNDSTDTSASTSTTSSGSTG